MKISHEIKDFASEGKKEMSEKFKKSGGKIYCNNILNYWSIYNT